MPSVDPPNYYEEAGWPKGVWNKGEFTGIRRLICDWDDRFALIDWIDRYPNSIYPYADGPVDAIATQAAIEGMGEQGSETYSPTDGLRAPMVLATYPKARVTIKYSTEGPRHVGGGTFLSEWLLPDVTTMPLNPAIFRWNNNTGKVLDEGERPVHMRYSFQYVIRYHQLVAVPSWVLTRVGTCNSNVVGGNLLGLTFAAQRLLFQPPTIKSTLTVGGRSKYEVTIHYKYHPAGWNKFWRQSTATYEDIYLAGGGQYIQYPPVQY
jgi:hypothetical protein